eukprot:2148509-Pleurochrysis_carterae.AAC.7
MEGNNERRPRRRSGGEGGRESRRRRLRASSAAREAATTVVGSAPIRMACAQRSGGFSMIKSSRASMPKLASVRTRAHL